MKPSVQQQVVIDSENPRMEVIAGPGSGKSTLIKLRAIAKPHEQMLYLTFSADARKDAQAKMAGLNNVLVHSVNSLAYQVLKREFSQEKMTGFLNNWAIRSHFPEKTPKEIGVIYQLVTNFLNSDEKTPPEEIEAVWEAMTDPSQSLPLGHSGTLKLFELGLASGKYSGHPIFATKDIVVLDEFQDSNPVTVSVFELLPGKKLKVLDPHQALYGFRGAIAGAQQTAGYTRFPLQQSFRFGSVVADVANEFLFFCGDDFRILPIDKPDFIQSRMASKDPVRLPRNASRAFICRKNATALSKAMEMTLGVIKVGEDGEETRTPASPFIMVGGCKRYKIDDALDLAEQLVELKPSKNRNYRGFKSIDDIQSYLEETGDDDQVLNLFSTIHKMIKTEEIIPTLKKIIAEESGFRARFEAGEDSIIQITNVHGCKGMEFDAVVMANDFYNFFADKEFEKNGFFNWLDPELKEELNLLYVAATRAKHFLRVNQIVESIEEYNVAIRKQQERLAAEVAAQQLQSTMNIPLGSFATEDGGAPSDEAFAPTGP